MMFLNYAGFSKYLFLVPGLIVTYDVFKFLGACSLIFPQIRLIVTYDVFKWAAREAGKPMGRFNSNI